MEQDIVILRFLMAKVITLKMIEMHHDMTENERETKLSCRCIDGHSWEAKNLMCAVSRNL
jgi:hypothetical protein